MSFRSLVSFLAAIPFALFAAETPVGASTEERFQRMEQALQQLQQRNTELEEKVRRLEARETAARATAPTNAIASARPPTHVADTPPASDGNKATVAVERAPAFDLRLSGFIQTQVEVGDVSAFVGRFPDNPANVLSAGAIADRFVIRRARLSLNGTVAEQFEFRVEAELFSGVDSGAFNTSVAARDVFVNWRPLPEFNLKIGQFKSPFGLEQLTSDSRLISIEPSLVTAALTAERQIGVQVWGRPFANLWPERPDFLTYYAGVFNGSGANTSLNDNNEFMYAGRLEMLAFDSQLFHQEASLRLGANGFYSRDEFRNIVSDALLVNDDGSLSPFNFFPAGTREAFGFDAALRVGRFDLIAEYLNQRLTPREASGFIPQMPALQPSGYYVQGSYFVIPDKLQLVAKWESFDPDQRANDDIESLTAGVNYYIRGDEIKLLANYIHTWSDYRAKNPQFGRAEFDQVTVRLQVMF